MMKKILFAAAGFLFLFVSESKAQTDIFGLEENKNVGIDNKDAGVYKISSFLTNKITKAAARNIENAEKVFCYTVGYADPDYEGYLIQGMAVTGSCGELSSAGKQLLNKSLFDNSVVYSNSFDSCTINPKVLFRYVYGPDYTDVLLSSPCSAVVFFHDRDAVTVNAAPGKEIIEKIAKAYANLSEKYLSPALLGQMVANGQVINQTQKEMVRRLNSSEKNLKKWNSDKLDSTQSDTTTSTGSSAKKGWNKLK